MTLLASTPLDDFLAGADGSDTADQILRGGVVLGVVGTLLALGVLTFLLTTWSSDVGGRRRLEAAVVAGGVIAMLGGLVEAIATSSIRDVAVIDVLAGEGGSGAMMRVAGGALVALGLIDRFVGLAGVVEAPGDRWRPSATAFFSIAGAVIAGLSFAFDGHTLSRGDRALHAITNVVHVAAGAVWFGGLVALAMLAVRRGADIDGADWTILIHRFTSTATVALVVVAAAGIVMAVFVLDGWSDLTGTAWGRFLLVKAGLVGVAASVGAYQHFVVTSRLPEVPVRAVRAAVAIEATVLATVVVVTGLLTTASTIPYP